MVASKTMASWTLLTSVLAAAGAGTRPYPYLKTETLDTDPGWAGVNNLVDQRGPYKRQGFGSIARRERIHGRYRLLEASHGAEDVLFSPDGRWNEWALRYDPSAAGGNGAITLWFGDQMQTVPLAPGGRKRGAVMDRFGMFNMQDNNGKDCLVYLDDLRYTSARPGGTK